MCAQSIQVLSLQENNFMGELPTSWAALGRFPALGYLELWKNSLSGAVPAAWGNYNAFPALRSLCARLLKSFVIVCVRGRRHDAIAPKHMQKPQSRLYDLLLGSIKILRCCVPKFD